MTGTRGLKAVYLAPTEDAAPQAPEAFGDVWEPHYYHAIESLNSVTRHSSIKNKKNSLLRYKNRPCRERENTGVVGKAEKLTWHKAWTMVSTSFSISCT